MSDPRARRTAGDPAAAMATAALPVHLVDGTTPTLAELAGTGPLVVFFFPAAFSPGCVAEACAFRDLAGEFAAVGATCVGVSADTPRRLRAFARSFRLGLPLASDRTGRLASRFGAGRRFPARLLRRVTVVTDATGLELARVEGLTDLAAHADAALAYLTAAASAASPGAPGTPAP